MPELQLQNHLKEKFNAAKFNFQRIGNNFDLIDHIYHIAVEVKKEDNHAAEQLLYATANVLSKGTIIKYVGLMDSEFALFFNCPPTDKVLGFQEYVVKDRNNKPTVASNVPSKYRTQAFAILGDPILVCSTKKVEISPQTIFSKSGQSNSAIHVTPENLKIIKKLLADKYAIDIRKFLNFIFSGHPKSRSSLKINEKGWIYDSLKLITFRNIEKERREMENMQEYQGDYTPIKDHFDSKVISSLVVDQHFADIMRMLNSLADIEQKRTKGRVLKYDPSETTINVIEGSSKYDTLDQLLTSIYTKFKPDVIIEAYARNGDFVKDIPHVKKNHCVINNSENEMGIIESMRNLYSRLNPKWKFTSFNLLDYSLKLKELLNEWDISCKQKMLILTNPPYGTSSTNKEYSKSREIKSTGSRKVEIPYPRDTDKNYGRGDFVLPTIGTLVDICQKRGKGVIAFFAPLGLFCGRNKFNKLFSSLLKNFVFHGGYIFPGDIFLDVDRAKPIAFTIWEYGGSTCVKSIYFNFKDREIRFRGVNILRDYWYYDSGDKGCPNEGNPYLAVSHCETFHSPGKFFKFKSCNLHKNGKLCKHEIKKILEKNKQGKITDCQCDREFCEHVEKRIRDEKEKILKEKNSKFWNCQRDGKLCEHTIKKKMLGLPYSQELLISIWSTIVGRKSLTSYPLYLDNAHVHLPDFRKEGVLEIVALGLLYNLIYQIKDPLKYSQGHIGFFDQTLIFGDKTGCSDYADEVEEIINRFSNISIDSSVSDSSKVPTVLELFCWLKNDLDIHHKKHKDQMDVYLKILKEEVERRLWNIDYFGDFIPFPLHDSPSINSFPLLKAFIPSR